MARPKEFNRDEALEAAIQLFWTQGYEATTMTDLRKAMGIGRQSLYDTFGDKQQLFGEALQRYVESGDARLEQLLAGKGLEGIRAYLVLSIRQMTEPSFRRGCLTLNTCVELAPRNADVAACAQGGLASMRSALEASLQIAKQRGEIPKETDTAKAALFLTNQIAGIAVLGKAGTTKAELETIAELALTAIS
jgi:TetR/AcrR family transcriptional regulator, transcriptional repressor for nem operon